MATSPIVPKERLSAYQRWELGSFDTPASPPNRAASPGAKNTAEQQAQQLNLHARGEGYREGHREGLEAGRREALAEVAPRIARRSIS